MLHRGNTSSNGTQETNVSPTPAIHDERHTTPVMTRTPAATRPCCNAASPAADPSCCRSGFSRELLIWAPTTSSSPHPHARQETPPPHPAAPRKTHAPQPSYAAPPSPHAWPGHKGHGPYAKIGRASCRERVCQSV